MKDSKLWPTRELQRNSTFDINVNDMTNDDLIAVVAELERTSMNALEQLLMEADLAGKISYVRVRNMLIMIII